MYKRALLYFTFIHFDDLPCGSDLPLEEPPIDDEEGMSKDEIIRLLLLLFNCDKNRVQTE